MRLAKQIISLQKELDANRSDIDKLVQAVHPALLEIQGIGPVNAALILTAWSHPGRVRSEAAFAALAGTCPVPASSGGTTRYRLNRGGDRQLNKALHTVALVRMNYDQDTKDYVARRTHQGRNKNEIIRSLKRYITRQIYRTLSTPNASLLERPTHPRPRTSFSLSSDSGRAAISTLPSSVNSVMASTPKT